MRLSEMNTDALSAVFAQLKLKAPLACTCRAMNAAAPKGALWCHFREFGKGGSVQLLQWVRANGYPMAEIGNMYYVAIGGNVPALQWMRSPPEQGGPGVRATRHDVSGAAMHGQLPMLKYLLVNVHMLHPNGAMTMREIDALHIAAAGSGHVHVLEWLRKYRPITYRDTEVSVGSHAAMGGHLAVIKWVNKHTNYLMRATQCLSFACEIDNGLPLVQYLVGDPAMTLFPGSCLKNVVECGQLEILKWVHEVGLVSMETLAQALTAIENGYWERPRPEELINPGMLTSRLRPASGAEPKARVLVPWLREQLGLAD